jgi:hypothetical protein
MRLTLRTLLAWMDDTLEPGQVREIGKQVAESPFAQELSDRINRVTRQRRLSVPSSSGSDVTDPNVVASYLDNDLDADGVAEFEKRCLTLDVNLAEVASVHQILSLLGQKVKVPDEARTRMYQLVKGREAIAPRRPASARRVVKEPVTKPIQPWVVPEPPKRPWIERYGPAAACVLLILLSSWAAKESLTKPPEPAPPPLLADSTGQPAGASGAAPAEGPVLAGGPTTEAGKLAAAGPEAAANADVVPPPGADVTPEPAPAPEPAAAAKTAAAEKPKPAPLPVVPQGAVGVAEKAEGILLREELGQWVRLDKETPLKTLDRVLCLEPFPAVVDVGKIRIYLVRETEIRILSQPTDTVPTIELVQGRIAIRQPAANALKVVFANQTVALEMSSDSVFGMERVMMQGQGAYPLHVAEPMPLGILCKQGEVTIAVGATRQTLKAMNTALVGPAGQFGTGSRPDLPPWVTQTESTGYELQMMEQFLKLFHANRPVLTDLVSAIDDDREEIKVRAIGALESMGDLSYLTPTLSRPKDPLARRITIAAIRVYMMQGPEAAGRVRKALDEEFGDERLGGLAHHMLIGYTPEEAAKPDLYNRLVELLSPEQDSLALRELALETLMRLTGRDNLGYDPDKPAGKGFDAWNDLLRRNELRSPAGAPRNDARSTPAPPRPGRTKNGGKNGSGQR